MNAAAVATAAVAAAADSTRIRTDCIFDDFSGSKRRCLTDDAPVSIADEAAVKDGVVVDQTGSGGSGVGGTNSDVLVGGGSGSTDSGTFLRVRGRRRRLFDAAVL